MFEAQCTWLRQNWHNDQKTEYKQLRQSLQTNLIIYILFH
uniref:Uncharacterized protein n=1 Tax=Rhizophora mucronata TaxID=61149 RepID=A0A2P2N8R9_RHIMU